MVGSPVHVLYVTHYFHPEVGAPQTRILESAQRLAAHGHAVTALTGFPNYPDGVIPAPYRGRLMQTEWVGPVRVIRSAVYAAPNRGFARRLLNHASSAISSTLASPRAGPTDVVIAESPPLFTAAAGVLIARLRRAPLVLNVADLWPESAVQLGALRDPRAIRLAEAMERFAYRHAALIAVPTPGMRDSLLSRGLPDERVVHLPNAVDIDRFGAAPAPVGRERPRIVYSGTVGMAQGIGTLLEAARILEAEGDELEFLVAGDGAERPQLEALAREWGLRSVTFAGKLPRERIPAVIGGADIAVLTLRDLPLFEDALPSKLLEYMAAGRPVAAGAAGLVASVVEAAGAGLVTPPEDASALAASIRRLARDPVTAAAMGASGRRYVHEHFSRDAVVGRLERLLREVAGQPGRERVRAV
jgi:glycosyltransferase involved in cell wall biosynthesis